MTRAGDLNQSTLNSLIYKTGFNGRLVDNQALNKTSVYKGKCVNAFNIIFKLQVPKQDNANQKVECRILKVQMHTTEIYNALELKRVISLLLLL